MTRRKTPLKAITGGSDIPGHQYPPRDLQEVHSAYTKWFGRDYDLQALDCTLCAAAAERLDGDPPWILLVGGSGAAKTETIMPLTGAGAHVVSTISGEGALLSATGRRERAKNATGGLLKSIGERGLLVIKDVTSILGMNRDARAAVLAALREIYDGQWSRTVGTDGGQTIGWKGRLVIIGGVTTAWDSHHQVVATMGDRFLLVRLSSNDGELRRAATRQAMRNVDSETTMRTELRAAVGGLLNSVERSQRITLTDEEVESLISTADLVTRARTAVERDFHGNPESAHALEMPTRFGKQLVQIVRGGIAIGMDRPAALRCARRCAADSFPPLRLRVLLDVAAQPGGSTTADVVKRLQVPRNTVDRVLKELQLLQMLDMTEIENPGGRWPLRHYSVSKGVDLDVLTAMAMSRNVGTPRVAAAPDAV
jgi:hypothetical protein